MHEPVSNARVEHVLASIRRLLTEEEGRDRAHVAPSHDAGSAPAAPSGRRERLLLTPAFRVSGPSDDRSTPGGSDESLPDPLPPQAETPARPTAPGAGRTSVFRLDNAVRLRGEGPRPGAGAGGASARAGSGHADPSEGSRSAQAPETGPADAEPGSAAPQAPSRRRQRPVPDRALEAKIAALESVIARTEDNWEPDGDGDPSSTGAPRAEAQPYRLEPAARRDVPQVRAARDKGAVASLTDLVDEDMLREIVADIVREELRGALGERITRNVRKLVRREILRAVEEKDD